MDKWRIRLANEETRDFVPGPKWLIRGVSFRAVSVALDGSAEHHTEMEDRFTLPDHRCKPDTKFIHADGNPWSRWTNRAQVGELIAVKDQHQWEPAAGQIWANGAIEQLRRRWDISWLTTEAEECRSPTRSDPGWWHRIS